MKKLRILFVCHECNPNWASVPLLGYRIFNELAKHVDLTLVTHERNQNDLLPLIEGQDVRFIPESNFCKAWYKYVANPGSLYGRIWALNHALSLPIFQEFNKRAFEEVREEVESGSFDVIHVFTPIIPRFPTEMRRLVDRTPVIFGPVNGGLAYPPGFEHIGKAEFDIFNKLRCNQVG